MALILHLLKEMGCPVKMFTFIIAIHIAKVYIFLDHSLSSIIFLNAVYKEAQILPLYLSMYLSLPSTIDLTFLSILSAFTTLPPFSLLYFCSLNSYVFKHQFLKDVPKKRRIL